MTQKEWVKAWKSLRRIENDYESSKISLTKAQKSALYESQRDLKRECPHDGAVEVHWLNRYEDEFSTAHYQAHCDIYCQFCTEKLDRNDEYQTCKVNGETVYSSHGGRDMWEGGEFTRLLTVHKVGIFHSRSYERTGIDAVIDKKTAMYAVKPPEPPKAKPVSMRATREQSALAKVDNLLRDVYRT